MNEAELLFTQLLDCDRLSLYLDKGASFSKDKSALVSSVLKRRINGEPIQYILGKAEFMGFEFKVTPDVLIPRPETEILVETALNQFRAHSSELIGKNTLDLGTGSGCIAISLAKLLKGAKITACDISPEALVIAKENARFHDVNIDFIKSDLFSSYELRAMSYELIISNPPYIPTAEINILAPELQYEPRIALDGGKDGLNFYRKLINESPAYLNEKGFLIFEIGFNQKESIEELVLRASNLKIVEIVKDYNNIDRVVVIKKG